MKICRQEKKLNFKRIENCNGIKICIVIIRDAFHLLLNS